MDEDPVLPASTGVAADVFISYSHANRAFAAHLAETLAAHRLSVWWDRELVAGTEFAGVIEAQLDAARVVLTLWSGESVRSAYVRDESARALRAGKLLPLRIEDVELPLGFGQTHTLDLIGWRGDPEADNFQHLLRELLRRKGELLAAPTPRGPSLLERWRAPGIAAIVGAAALALAGLAYLGKTAWDAREERERVEAARQKSELEAAAARQKAEAQATQDRQEADRLFRSGLEHQHAKEPELVSALNAYLSALELRPGHARARYYLAHVYVQRGQPADALASFKLALAGTEAPLDNSQRADANKQLLALAPDPDEAAPVARSADPVVRPKVAAKMAAARPPVPPPLLRGGPAERASEPVVARAPAPPVAGTSAWLPRPAPPPATLGPLTARVDAMFDADKERRISATTSLIVDPDALSDAVPLAVAKALAALRAPAAPLAEGASSGIVNTLVLLQSALPGTLEVQRRPIEELLAATVPLGPTTRQHADKVAVLLKAAAAHRPLAFIQIANEAQRPLAQAMAARFRAVGYDAPGIEAVGDRAPARSEVRVHGKSERGFARWVAKIVGDATGSDPELTTLRAAAPKSDTYEIWIERGLCAPAGRQVAGCKGTGQ